MTDKKLLPEVEEKLMQFCNDDPYTCHNHIETVLVEKDHACMRVALRPEHMNLMNIPHGGLYFTLADDTASMAVMSDGGKYVTQNSDFRFIRYSTEGYLHGEAYVLHRGGHVCITRVTITDDAGNLLCEGSFSFFKLKNAQ